MSDNTKFEIDYTRTGIRVYNQKHMGFMSEIDFIYDKEEEFKKLEEKNLGDKSV